MMTPLLLKARECLALVRRVERRRLRRARKRHRGGPHFQRASRAAWAPWMWASGHSAATVKRAAHGYEATREEAMAAFAKSWHGQR